jgi:autotransporter passenger strand-loop-strand repeat protein
VSGGTQAVESGGTASGTTIKSGVGSLGQQAVSAGALAVSATAIGAQQNVSFGGTASGTTLVSGGIENVSGIDISGAIESGGVELVFSGATASGDTVSSDGTAVVFSGATAGGDTVSSGGVAVWRHRRRHGGQRRHSRRWRRRLAELYHLCPLPQTSPIVITTRLPGAIQSDAALRQSTEGRQMAAATLSVGVLLAILEAAP